MIYYCLHFKLDCHFFKAFGGLAQKIIPCFTVFHCLVYMRCVLYSEHLLLLGFAHWGFWGDCSCMQVSAVWLMRVWSCVHCFIFVLLQGYSQRIEFCESRLPVLYLLLSHWVFFRGHVIVRQPRSNRSHTLLLEITAKRGMCVLICYYWSGYSYCLFSAPWQSRNKLWSVPCVYSVMCIRLGILWWICF